MVHYRKMSKIGKAGGDLSSLQTTVPKEIVKKMGLKSGDYMRWEESKEVGKFIVTFESGGEVNVKKEKNRV